MAYEPHYRIQWGGGIYNATTGGARVEIWSNTLSLAATGGYDPASGISAIASALSGFHSRATSLIDARCALEYVKVNQIGADGKYVNPISNTEVVNVRGGGGNSNPISCALKVTLDDGSRNPRHRGGFYLPCSAAPIGTDWQIATTYQTQLLSSVTTLMSDLNGPNVKVCIASSVDGSLAVVTRARVGRQPDNMNSRRNAMPESYLVGTINPAL